MARPAILIPAHNRRALTLGCLARLRAQGDLNERTIIVIDDGSTDGTGESISAEHPEVVVLQGNGALYWTGAIRLGMSEALARGCGPIVWLNDDCWPRAGALAALCRFLIGQPDTIAGPRCIDTRTGLEVATGFIRRTTQTVRPGEVKRVQGLSGFCVGLGSAAVAKLGLPDAKRFPHYFGDTAYTLAASQAGTNVLLLGDAMVDLVDHHDANTALEKRLDLGRVRGAVWREIFASPTSPYRLQTLFALQRLKYGVAIGTAAAIARALQWLATVGRAQIARKASSM